MAHRYMYRVHIVTHLPRLHLCCNYCCVYRRHTRTKWRTRDFSAERSGGDRSPVHHRNTYACPSSLLITGPSLRAPQAYLGSTYIRWMHTCHGELMLELGPQKPCTYVVPVTPRPPPPPTVPRAWNRLHIYNVGRQRTGAPTGMSPTRSSSRCCVGRREVGANSVPSLPPARYVSILPTQTPQQHRPRDGPGKPTGATPPTREGCRKLRAFRSGGAGHAPSLGGIRIACR